MNRELTKWFKDNCKDVGHINYGKIKEIIAKHEAKEDLINRKFSTLINRFLFSQ